MRNTEAWIKQSGINERGAVPSPACGGGLGRGPGPRKANPTVDQKQKPKWHVSEEQRSRARALRRDMTEAERIIWYNVRAHRFQGAGFRRQTPIGPYVVDFVSHAAKLIVEVDGGQHFEPENIMRDARRDAYLRAQGYRVLRFNNLDVIKNKTGVLQTIAATLRGAEAPSLTLPRKRGRGLGHACREEVP